MWQDFVPVVSRNVKRMSSINILSTMSNIAIEKKLFRDSDLYRFIGQPNNNVNILMGIITSANTQNVPKWHAWPVRQTCPCPSQTLQHIHWKQRTMLSTWGQSHPRKVRCFFPCHDFTTASIEQEDVVMDNWVVLLLLRLSSGGKPCSQQTNADTTFPLSEAMFVFLLFCVLLYSYFTPTKRFNTILRRSLS